MLLSKRLGWGAAVSGDKESHLLCTSSLDIRRHFCTPKVIRHWKGMPRELLEVFQKPQCSGLIVRVVFGQRLDSTILEVFPNPNDSVIL